MTTRQLATLTLGYLAVIVGGIGMGYGIGLMIVDLL